MLRVDFNPGLTEGPFALLMQPNAAREFETVLKAEGVTDKDGYRRYELDGVTETDREGRTDVSWITVESPDKEQEIILTDGLNDSVIKQNNIVTINHHLPAIGKSTWRKKHRTTERKGMLAETKYLERPEGFDERDKWVGDAIFDLVVQKAMRGKSVGILPVPSAVRGPTQQEIDRNPDWQGCKIYDRAYLVEYAVCSRPVHPETIVLTVTKGYPEVADDILRFLEIAKPVVKAERQIKGVPADAIPVLVRAQFGNYDFGKLAKELSEQAVAAKTGRIA